MTAERKPVRETTCRLLARSLLAGHRLALALVSVVGNRPRRREKGPVEVLVTASFASERWILAHLGPLARSDRCGRIVLVTTHPMASRGKIDVVHPPKWLMRAAGQVVARLAMFLWLAVRRRPALVAGFHLLPNGLVALPAARLAGARSAYFCVGGPAEVLDGGLQAETPVFGGLGRPDAGLERRLIESIKHFDLVITMGPRAAAFFRRRGLRTSIEVLAGGVELDRPDGPEPARDLDVVFVGRLAPIKRVDRFLETVRHVRTSRPNVRAAIVGDGELRPQLLELASSLGLDGSLTFVGQQLRVGEFLRRARVLVLSSESEALSLAAIEAMMCGVPVVASDVGEMRELVEEGVNGYLVAEGDPQAAARHVLDLLTDGTRWWCFSQAARRSAMRYEPGQAAREWDRILAEMYGTNRD